MALPTNRTLTITRLGATVATNVAAFMLPASDELVAMQGTPAVKLVTILIDGLADVAEQDSLSSTDPAETYLVRIVKKIDTRYLPHTELICETPWGT